MGPVLALEDKLAQFKVQVDSWGARKVDKTLMFQNSCSLNGKKMIKKRVALSVRKHNKVSYKVPFQKRIHDAVPYRSPLCARGHDKVP